MDDAASCGDSYYFFKGKAVHTCPDGFFSPARGQPCQSCSADCATCSQFDHCTSCDGEKLLQPNGKCASTCGPLFLRQDRSQRTQGRIRLRGALTASEGRLEISHNGVFGTMCNSSFNMAAANVVCRELGFGKAGEIKYSKEYHVNPSSQILLDGVQCTGKEDSIFQCTHHGWNMHRCYHSQDVAIRCLGPDQRQRCVASCDLGFYYNSTINACSACSPTCMSCVQLGSCQSCGSNMYLNMHNLCVEDCGEGMYGSTSSGQCEKCHASCRSCKNGPVNNTCTSCHGDQNLDGNACIDGCPLRKKLLPRSIQLVGGESPLYGRLEVLHRGVWGTVCDDGFNWKAGEVACKALGLGSHIPTVYANPQTASQSGVGSVPKSIWLDNLRCSGNESNLFQCEHLPIGRSDCTHVEDVWLKCQSPMQKFSPPRCVKSCPATFFTNQTNPKCEHCVYSCATCSGTSDRCTSCGYGRFLSGSVCVRKCRWGFFGNTSSGLCTRCSSRCMQCKDGTRDDICTRCAYGKSLINQQCVDTCPAETASYSGRCHVTCPERTYRIGNQCRRCPRYCIACKTTRPTGRVECSSCQPRFTLNAYGRCGSNCPSGFTKEPFINTTGLDVRLIGLAPHSGRLEVLHNGTWGTVCRDGWTSRNSNTVCKRLGYIYGRTSRSGRPGNFPNYLSSTKDQPIWMSDVQCDRKHTSLGMCRHSGWGVNDCTHSQDVYLSCYGELRQYRCVRSCSAGSYRRSRVCDRCLGQCEECLGPWSRCPRCNSGFYLLNQTCRTICPDGYFGDSSSGQCSRCNQSCAACKNSSSSCTACPTGYYLRGGRCETDCKNGFIPKKFPNAQLVGGPSSSEGYVLIATAQKGFGYICDDYWSLADGHVICRQLNLGHASKVYVKSYFKNVNASIPILLDNMLCKGNETSLLDCRHNGIGVHNCQYSEIAAVKCAKSHPSMECLSSCNTSAGFYVDGKTCANCDVSCKTCTGHRMACSSCKNGLYKLFSACLTECPDGYFEDISSGDCIACHNSCRTCSGPLPSNCTDCNETQGKTAFLKGSACVETCSGEDDYIYTISQKWRDSIRLFGMGEVSDTAGRIEVLNPTTGSFGTVCDDFFDWREARVVCRQLGLGDPVTIYKQYNSSRVYNNSDPNITIVLDNLNCRGDELSLFDCKHAGVGIHNCFRSESAGVKCNFYPSVRAKQCKTGCGKGHRVASQSPPTCQACPVRCETCDEAMTCIFCKTGLFMLDRECKLECPAGYFGNTRTRICEECANHCGTCFNGPTNDTCMTCNASQNLYINKQSCKTSCPPDAAPIFSSFSLDKSSVRLDVLSLIIQGTTYPVCSSHLTGQPTNIGQVACRQIGYAFKAYTLGRFYRPRSPLTPRGQWLQCRGNEPSLLNCSRSQARQLIGLSTLHHLCFTFGVLCDTTSRLFHRSVCTRSFASSVCNDSMCEAGCFNSASGRTACWPCPSPLVGDGEHCASKYLCVCYVLLFESKLSPFEINWRIIKAGPRP